MERERWMGCLHGGTLCCQVSPGVQISWHLTKGKSLWWGQRSRPSTERGLSVHPSCHRDFSPRFHCFDRKWKHTFLPQAETQIFVPSLGCGIGWLRASWWHHCHASRDGGLLADSCGPLLVSPEGTRLCMVMQTGSLYTARGWDSWMPRV